MLFNDLLSLIQVCILPSLYGLKTMQEGASSTMEVIALLIYGIALFFLFTTSTVYHCLSFAGDHGYGSYLILVLFIKIESWFIWAKNIDSDQLQHINPFDQYKKQCCYFFVENVLVVML